MGKLCFSRILNSFCVSPGSNSCFCISSFEAEDEIERKPLTSEGAHLFRLKDLVDGNQTLAFHLKPKMVVLRVSMHCNGCARKIQKHISKIEGVTSYQVDLESKMVVVIGDISPFEVLESVCKVKTAELWTFPSWWKPHFMFTALLFTSE